MDLVLFATKGDFLVVEGQVSRESSFATSLRKIESAFMLLSLD
jgi:hypothetical protein